MQPINISIQSVEKLQDGRIIVIWSDGSSSSFLNLTEVYERIAKDLSGARPILETLLLHWWLNRDPSGDNASIITSKNLIFDVSAEQPITLS